MCPPFLGDNQQHFAMDGVLTFGAPCTPGIQSSKSVEQDEFFKSATSCHNWYGAPEVIMPQQSMNKEIKVPEGGMLMGV